MFKKLIHVMNGALCAVLIFQLVGCGTILYPERKGQKSGKIDVGVALLDGIGLLFFLIPGIIAYAVDFNNGTIYLPGTAFGSLKTEKFREVKFDPKKNTMAGIEDIVKRETGYDVHLYQSQMTIVKLESSDDMMEHFEEAFSGMHSARVVLLGK